VNVPAPAPPPIIQFLDLLELAQRPDDLSWQPLYDGVDVHRLYGDSLDGPSAVLLLFREAASIPFHCHDGYEHIFVLAGSQRDEFGLLPAGTLRIHPPGTSHHVTGEAGCVVLAIYEKPVRFERTA
jgi:anti-sigma factor ChrR (cupin superfamily)